MVADGLGLAVEEISETIEPVVAKKPVHTEYLSVTPGQVAGVHQIARGLGGNREKVYLELQMYVGAENPTDSVELAGEPNLTLIIPGGIHGDLATAAVAVNCIPAIAEAEPGLRTARDIPMCFLPGRTTT